MSGVVVLNTDNTALHTVSIKHAIKMLVREVAIVEEAHEGRRIGPYSWPLVLRLIRYVKTTFLYAKSPTWSKRGVLRRDHHHCAYRGGTAETVDHLVPQSRGGGNTRHNTVAACLRCNNLGGEPDASGGGHDAVLEACCAALAGLRSPPQPQWLTARDLATTDVTGRWTTMIAAGPGPHGRHHQGDENGGCARRQHHDSERDADLHRPRRQAAQREPRRCTGPARGSEDGAPACCG